MFTATGSWKWTSARSIRLEDVSHGRLMKLGMMGYARFTFPVLVDDDTDENYDDNGDDSSNDATTYIAA